MSTLDLHTSAVLEHLAASGIPVGDAVKPGGAGWQGAPGQSAFLPYAILWRLGSQDARSWSMDGTYTEARPLMFLRAFGASRAQTEQTLDTLRARLLDQSLPVPGRTVLRVALDTSTTTTRSDDTEVGLFEAGDYYRIRTDPKEDS